jgi:hypothetical protein
MGFEVTIFLALVVYIDVIQGQVPVWTSVGDTPRIMWLFVISIMSKLFSEIACYDFIWSNNLIQSS